MKKIYKWWFVNSLPHQHRKIGLRSFLIHPFKRRIAKYYLVFLRKIFGIKVIGITGSAGKTTVKEMVASILAKEGKTIASIANIDPIYNIPTTILKCSPTTKYLVLEMGVEFKGEMDFYLWLAKPDIGIITNIYPTHTEFFDNEEGVYKEKSKLVKTLNKNSYAVLNSEDKRLQRLKGNLKCHTVWYGSGSIVDAKNVKIGMKGTEFTLITDSEKNSIHLPISGKQFVSDALAAASTAFALGIQVKNIKKGLETFDRQENRMVVYSNKVGTLIVDDSYNSNPEAVISAVETFKDLAGRKKTVAVLGDMLELGDKAKSEHLRVGKYIKEAGIDYLISVGDLAKLFVKGSGFSDKKAFEAGDVEEAYRKVKEFLTPDYAILIKGSRSIGLDKLAKKLS